MTKKTDNNFKIFLLTDLSESIKLSAIQKRVLNHLSPFQKLVGGQALSLVNTLNLRSLGLAHQLLFGMPLKSGRLLMSYAMAINWGFRNE